MSSISVDRRSLPTAAKRRKRPDPARRPFAKGLLERARQIADRYQIVLWREDGHWFGCGLEEPFAMGDGRKPDEAVKVTRKSLVSSVATTIENGGTPTAPAAGREGRRDRQINVRVSEDERLRLERLAHARGFKGSADYLRALALAG